MESKSAPIKIKFQDLQELLKCLTDDQTRLISIIVRQESVDDELVEIFTKTFDKVQAALVRAKRAPRPQVAVIAGAGEDRTSVKVLQLLERLLVQGKSMNDEGQEVDEDVGGQLWNRL